MVHSYLCLCCFLVPIAYYLLSLLFAVFDVVLTICNSYYLLSLLFVVPIICYIFFTNNFLGLLVHSPHFVASVVCCPYCVLSLVFVVTIACCLSCLLSLLFIVLVSCFPDYLFRYLLYLAASLL